MTTTYKEGDNVHVRGIVSYGDKRYAVDTYGIVQVIYSKDVLITLDIVDGDSNVGCLVKKKDIVGVIYG